MVCLSNCLTKEQGKGIPNDVHNHVPYIQVKGKLLAWDFLLAMRSDTIIALRDSSDCTLVVNGNGSDNFVNIFIGIIWSMAL